MNPLNRTKTIGVKVTQDSYEGLKTVAENQGKPLAEWCREKLLEAGKGRALSLAERALMAEIAATQNVTVTLLYEMANGRKLSRERVQEILDSANATKYAIADERLRFALAERPERVSVGSRTRK